MDKMLLNVRGVVKIHKRCLKHWEFKLSASQESVSVNHETEDVRDELEKKRDVCRLPDRVRGSHLKMEMFPLDRREHYILRNVRKYYAAYGKKSGINPGLMWPSKEYLKELKRFETEFQPSLNEMITKAKEKREEQLKARKEREELIEKNMNKLADYMKDFETKKARKQAEAETQRQRKEKLVEEVQEYLGYQIDPNDERFKLALELKEEEERKAVKKAKKQAREQKMLSMLLEATSTKSDTK